MPSHGLELSRLNLPSKFEIYSSPEEYLLAVGVFNAEDVEGSFPQFASACYRSFAFRTRLCTSNTWSEGRRWKDSSIQQPPTLRWKECCGMEPAAILWKVSIYMASIEATVAKMVC